MFTSDAYQLIDFGDARRLERFGHVVLDRPCPAVEKIRKAHPEAWDLADARFERTGASEGRWTHRGELPDRWTVTHGPVTFELRPTEVGHLGIFPEQAANWDWIAKQLTHPTGPDRSAEPMKILNLFAYTGGSTLAAAAAGAEVVHVDAARTTVDRARRNAELSGMSDAPIRWIADDAMKFVGRELKRGNRYDAVILDPPSYGHGSRGEVWRLSDHLEPLLEICGRLTAHRRRFILLTCHTPKFDAARLEGIVARALGYAGGNDGGYAGGNNGRSASTAAAVTIRASDGRGLPCGEVVRWLAG